MKNPAWVVNDLLQQISVLKSEFPSLQDDPELLADTLEGETNLHEIIDRLVMQVRENDTLAEALTARAAMIGDRRTRATTRMNFCRALIYKLMIAAGADKIKTTEGNVSVVNSPEKVIITDESAIPEGFMRIKKEPDKTAIKKALSSGKNVSGASLSNGGTTLMIR
jgi:hypothetical protein